MLYWKNLEYEDLTREERVELLLTDWETYRELVPGEYWLQLLSPLGKLAPVDPNLGE